MKSNDINELKLIKAKFDSEHAESLNLTCFICPYDKKYLTDYFKLSGNHSIIEHQLNDNSLIDLFVKVYPINIPFELVICEKGYVAFPTTIWTPLNTYIKRNNIDFTP